MISVQGLSKQFASGRGTIDVLKTIDLEIGQGDRVALVGASGAGKTTFMHLLGGLDRPSSGKILFEGQDIYRFSASELDLFRNRKLGFVFQFHQLLPEFSALENVMMPALINRSTQQEAKERALELLEKVGLGHRTDHKPGQLSGGEQQRVAIARALIMSPKVLLADEPTGNLDSVTSEGILALLDQVHADYGLTMVVVTHSQVIASRLDRVVKMEDGKIVA